MTSMKVRSKPSLAAPGDQVVELVLVDALQRHGVDLDREAGVFGRSMPSITWSSLPQRVMAGNFSGSSVSSETLMRRTPAAASSLGVAGELAAVGGERQLVERAGRQMAAERANKLMTLRRTSGSPPVSRSLRTPRRTKALHSAVELLQRQISALGRKVMSSAMQ